EEMVPNETTVVSKDVEDALKKTIRFASKTYTTRQIVDSLLKPRGGRNTRQGQRAFILKNTIEPLFDELLQKDLDEWDPKKPKDKKDQSQQGQKGQKGEKGEEEE